MPQPSESAPPCEACGQQPGDYEGLCWPCYDTAVTYELSCDWLDDDRETP